MFGCGVSAQDDALVGAEARAVHPRRVEPRLVDLPRVQVAEAGLLRDDAALVDLGLLHGGRWHGGRRHRRARRAGGVSTISPSLRVLSESVLGPLPVRGGRRVVAGVLPTGVVTGVGHVLAQHGGARLLGGVSTRALLIPDVLPAALDAVGAGASTKAFAVSFFAGWPALAHLELALMNVELGGPGLADHLLQLVELGAPRLEVAAFQQDALVLQLRLVPHLLREQRAGVVWPRDHGPQ